MYKRQGHGVPGAFMSLLNTSFLNEAINVQGDQRPGDMFNHVRSRLVGNIIQHEQKDGMDGVLIKYNKNHKSISYAAANNRPLLIRNNSVVPLSYDKMPVGKGEKNIPFSNYEFDVQPGDVSVSYTHLDVYKRQVLL